MRSGYWYFSSPVTEVSFVLIWRWFTFLMTARPVYRRNKDPSSGLLNGKQSVNSEKEQHTGKAGPPTTKLFSERSKTLRKAIQQLKPMQVRTWKIRTCTLSLIQFIYGGHKSIIWLTLLFIQFIYGGHKSINMVVHSSYTSESVDIKCMHINPNHRKYGPHCICDMTEQSDFPDSTVAHVECQLLFNLFDPYIG